MTLKRLGVIVLVAAVALGVWVSVRVCRNNADSSRASKVVRQLGGRMGSLPFLWTAEYYISFHSIQLSNNDLKRLTVLNPLAKHNIVFVYFIDTNLTGQDIRELRATLPRCAVYREIGNKIADD